MRHICMATSWACGNQNTQPNRTLQISTTCINHSLMSFFFCITSFLRRWGAALARIYLAKAINFMSFLEFFLRRTSVAIKLVNLKDLKPQAYSNQSARQPLKSSTIQWQGDHSGKWQSYPNPRMRRSPPSPTQY